MSKRIVLCSDGTGNAEGKNRGTNVFKIYKAIARHDEADPQVGFYDNGVGTDKRKVLRAIGGAFGYGFARNVKDLYTFLARTYEPKDEVFLFGFSRGAATVRAFAGFLHSCGLVDFRRGHDLDRERQDAMIERAFDAYRQGGDIAKEFKRTHSVVVPIKFIGVWDTVSALGFPKDLGFVIDALEWCANKAFPHRFYRFGLNDDIEHACQALALDDQRRTFRPRVWKESESKTHVDQVWFAGMHSNVGGGYPRQGMSNTALHWMMTQAARQGLEFMEGEVERVRASADETGRMYDSRAGLAVYYRLQPRDVVELSEGKVERIRIHETVLNRLELGTAGYAPGNLPSSFEVVHKDGTSRDVAGDEFNLDDYRLEMHKASRPIQLRKRNHTLLILLSLVTVVLVTLAGWREWTLPTGWALPMEWIGAASLLGCVLLLRRRMPTMMFATLGLAWVGVVGASTMSWFSSSGDPSPFMSVLTWLSDIATWFVPSFMEPVIVQALTAFVGVTSLLLLAFVWIWSAATDLRDECDRICERARKALRGQRMDLYTCPSPRVRKGWAG